MFRRRNKAIASLAICIGIALAIDFAWAQSSTMPGVENSVGYLSSGTSIEPRVTSESAPMVHGDLGNWTFMFHANVFLGTVQQTGPKGADKSFSTNWMMPMLTRRFGRQTITFRTMLSLEPATITKRQYPLLFQTGESAYGLSILNGQHPHDLFMEISGKYEVQLGERSQMFVYGGPISEAALGPAAFPHRASASENPLSTLGHHQQDSTHIAANVITLGVAHGPIQLEASTFHGREPNENRWNIDSGKPDSFAARLTLAPHKSISAQFSSGRIHRPEALDPALDTVRTTASIHHTAGFFVRPHRVELHLGPQQGSEERHAANFQFVQLRGDREVSPSQLGVDAHRKRRSRSDAASCKGGAGSSMPAVRNRRFRRFVAG